MATDKSKIIYLGHYSNSPHRPAFITAVTMMNYLIEALNESCGEIQVLSPCGKLTNEKTPREVSKINERTTLTYLACKGFYKGKNPFARLLAKVKREKLLYSELDSLISEGDTVIVYHSLAFIDVLRKLRKKKKFKLILQVCEIYADVTENKKVRKKEVSFIKEADSYIFSSSVLEKELNEDKPYAICMGAYHREDLLSTPNDDKIHLVYAGTFNPKKGGVFNAIECASYLDNRYHLHLFGRGDDKTNSLVTMRSILASEKSGCVITQDGYFAGTLYKKMLQACHIGIATQNVNDPFSKTSFPSKILVYLSNGLRVVSGKVLPVVESPLRDSITFYEEDTPEEIAKAIRSINLESEYDSRGLIDKLHRGLVEDLKKLIL